MSTLLRVNDNVFARIDGRCVNATIEKLYDGNRTAIVKTETGKRVRVFWSQIRLADTHGIPAVVKDRRSAVHKLLDLVRPHPEPIKYDTAVYCLNCRGIEHGTGGIQKCTRCGTEGMLRIAMMVDAQRDQIEHQTRMITALQDEVKRLTDTLTERPRRQGRIVGIIPAKMFSKAEKVSHQ